MITNKKGFGAIEIIIAAAIISITLFGLVSAFQNSLRVSRETGNKVQSGFLLEEGLEAARLMRDADWNNLNALATSTSYALLFENGSWVATTTVQYIDNKFERTILVEDVYRDANDDISPSGTFDPDTKKVTVYLSWSRNNATTTQSAATYLSNIFGS